MPTALADHLLVAAKRRFPPTTPNQSYLAFNLTHFAQAVADITDNKVGSESRSIRKIWENDQWPRETKLRVICQALEIDFDGLPVRPDAKLAARLDEGAAKAREVLAESALLLDGVEDPRAVNARNVLLEALHWFDEYHLPQRTSPGSP